MEYRAFPAERVAASDEGVIDGLVTPFGRETVIGDLDHGGFREEVAKGAFAKTLQEGDPLMVYQHDMSRPLARKSAGNLELREEADGLAVTATPVDTTYARDLRSLVKAKVIRGMSFGFNVVKDEWLDKDGKPSNRFDGVKRVLREIKLIEVSPVTRPAYTDTAISARDESNALIEQRQAHVDEAAPEPDEIDDEAEGHDESSDAEVRIKNGTKKRVVQASVQLKIAQKMLSDVKGQKHQEALALLSSATEHLGHIKDVEGVTVKDGKREKQEPDTSTPGEDEEIALQQLRMRDAVRKQRSRELGEL